MIHYAKKGLYMMKMKPVLKESLRLYKKNFPQLCLALLVQLVLRAMALSPLLFLAEQTLAPLAFLAIPLYLLIVLPARQNYALALKDMQAGGSVFSLQLICPKDYGKKLLRGLKGTVCILLWSALTIVSVTLLYAAYEGRWGLDVVTLMGICSSIGGGDFVNGLLIVAAAVAASCLLILLGCAVHSGSRHAAALGDKRLLKGRRMGLIALWFLGLLLVVPFAVLAVLTLGEYARTLLDTLMSLEMPSFSLNAKQTLVLVLGAVLLLLPFLPLKNLLPSVYLRMAKEKRDAAA